MNAKMLEEFVNNDINSHGTVLKACQYFAKVVARSDISKAALRKILDEYVMPGINLMGYENRMDNKAIRLMARAIEGLQKLQAEEKAKEKS